MRPIKLLALAAVSVALAACGSSNANSSSATGGAQGTVNSKVASMLAFASCMRSHGVPNFPDTPNRGGLTIEITPQSASVNGIQVNAPAFQAAMRNCRADLPNGGNPGPLSASMRAAALRFSRCMREHGLSNFPDPTFSSGGEIQLRGAGIDHNSPAFKAAQATCGTIIGKAGGP
jgi:hypothetical protein